MTPTQAAGCALLAVLVAVWVMLLVASAAPHRRTDEPLTNTEFFIGLAFLCLSGLWSVGGVWLIVGIRA